MSLYKTTFKNAILLSLFSPTLAIAQTSGKMNLDKWNGISGHATNYLQQNAMRLRPADASSLNDGAGFTNLGDNYGARLRGCITAPVTGDYTFFVAGDDYSELFLSSDDKPFNKQKIAWLNGYSGINQWNKSATQRSKSVSLVAGQKYYIEAQVKEGGGGDHLSIGWAYQDTSTPVSWVESAIGGNVTQTWTDQAGVLSLDVEAGDIWGTADHFAFRHRQWTGDGEFVAKISNMNNPHQYAKVGLMLRASLDADSSHALMMRAGNGAMNFVRRATAGAASMQLIRSQNKNWVKLVRKGDVVSAFVSENGVVWSHIGNQTIANLPQTVYIGIAATDNIGSNHVTATVSDFKTGFITATEEIPAAHLSSLAPDANDADDNHLPDDWETTHGIQAPTADLSSGKYGEYGDFDNDGISNLLEYQLGMNPAQRNVIAGVLSRETWYGIGGLAIKNLTNSNKFKSTPDLVEYGATINSHNRADNYGARYRGQVIAPTTGDYTFWISGDDEAELWIADGTIQPAGAAVGLKNVYGKHKVAWIQDSRFERNNTADEDFDRFASQRSKTIHLEAGQSYYLEVLHKEAGGGDHVSVAWQTPGGQREIIPSTAFSTAMPELDDVDKDNLPDAWETANGLDAANNGYGNTTEGEYGDKDADGLTNLQEYQFGTNPNSVDTDGDGINDYDEKFYYNTDATTSNQLAQSLHSQLALGAYQIATGDWYESTDGSIQASSRRGVITYPFTVTEAGIYEIKLQASIAGQNNGLRKLPLEIELNGVKIASPQLTSTDGAPATIKQLTGWLPAGNYTVGVRNLNYRTSLSLKINSLELFKIGGIDSDSNGVPDWADQKIASENMLVRNPTTSFTSPASIEGITPLLSTASMAKVLPNSATQALSLEASIDNGFYTNIPLNADTPTAYTVSFQNGAITQQHQITWAPTNILEQTEITIRKGDALRLSAWQGATFSGNFVFTQDGTAVNHANGNSLHTAPHQIAFNNAGNVTFTATWNSPDGTTVLTNTLVVKVVEADFGNELGIMAWNKRNWVPANIGHEFSIEADADLSWTETTEGQVNWATLPGTTATQSTTGWGGVASRAIDGNTNGNWGGGSVTHTLNTGVSWWQVDLGNMREISRVKLWNRSILHNRLSNYRVSIIDDSGATVISKDFYTNGGHAPATENWEFATPVNGKVVKVELLGGGENYLSIAECQVFGNETTLNKRSFDVSAYEAGTHNVIARLPSGEIIAKGAVDCFYIAETDQTLDTQVIQTYADGTSLMAYTIVADNLPANATIKLRSYFQGTTFLDGSNEKILTAADFDANGVATIFIEGTSFLKSCHYLDVFLAE